VKTGKNTYNIELALAGFNKKDIDVEYEDNNLVVKSKKADKAEASETTDEDGNMIHRGISKRHFLKSFTIASDVEVKGAELKDGLLTVALERIIPDAKKARSIEIK
jgi:molecular chaperone IbpA